MSTEERSTTCLLLGCRLRVHRRVTRKRGSSRPVPCPDPDHCGLRLGRCKDRGEPAARSTSLIRTLRERWSLGGPLTQHDAVAADLAPILSRSTPRAPEDWPEVSPRPIGIVAKIEEHADEPLSRLEKDIVGEALAHEARVNQQTSDVDVEKVSRKEALGHLKRIRDNMFPGVANGPDVVVGESKARRNDRGSASSCRSR